MYYADACWDCQREGDKGLKLYNHCLIPMTDRNEISDCHIVYTNTNNLPKAPEHLKEAIRLYKALKNNEITHRECKDMIIEYYEVTNQPINEEALIDKNETNWTKRCEMLDKNIALKKLEILIKYLKVHQHGDPISYEDFEQSLYNIYLAKGMTEKSAKSLLERTMNLNEKRSKKCFTDNATNCFTAGRKELEI